MLPLIYTDPGDARIFVAACLIWLVPEGIVNFRRAGVSRKSARIRDRGSLLVLVVLQWAGLVLSFSLAWFFPGGAMQAHRLASFIIGVVFILLGVGLRRYAVWTLGASFTRDVAVSVDQRVVQEGPYRFVRHPAYTGTFLTMLGVGLALSNWASLIALLLLVSLGHSYRVSVEEKALVQIIGQPYREYMRRTKRFIPLLF